jgi:hypothetical protein
MLLQTICFQSQALDELLPHYIIYSAHSKKLQRCCHVGIRAEGGCIFRVDGSSSEGDTGSTGETK